VFWAGAIAVGISAIALALGSEYANRAFRRVVKLSPVLPLLLCPLGLALVAWMTDRFFPEARGSGIPQTIAALDMREHASRSRVLSLRTALGKSGLIAGVLLERHPGGSSLRLSPRAQALGSTWPRGFRGCPRRASPSSRWSPTSLACSRHPSRPL
jgi:hypothetical protein